MNEETTITQTETETQVYFEEAFVINSLEALAEQMARKNVTKEQLATLCGLTKNRITRILNRGDLTLREYAALMHALEVTPRVVV